MTGLDLGIFMHTYSLMMALISAMVLIVGYLVNLKLMITSVIKKKYNDEMMKKAVEIVKNEPDNLLFPQGSKKY